MTPEIDTLKNKKSASPVEDPVPIKAVHHVELWVGNAKQAAYYYRNAFGFSQLAYSGLETGNRDYASYVLSQGNIRFVLSTPLNSGNGMTLSLIHI